MSGALDGRTPPPGSILSMTSRIYIDITTSVRWRRPPVGIVRIEREFARHCLRHEPDTVFCELDASGTYRALAAERVRAILDDAWCSANPGEAAANPVAAAPPTAAAPARRTRMQRFFDWLAWWGPRLVPAAAWPLLRDLGRVLVDHHGAWLRHRESRRNAPAAPVPVTAPAEPPPTRGDPGEIDPGPQDLFFSIGAQWHHGAIYAWHLKQKTGVRVVEACFDTTPIDFPEYSGSPRQAFAEHLLTIAHTANLIFVISDTTRDDLGAFFRRIGFLQDPPTCTVYLATPEVDDTPDAGLTDAERSSLQTVGEDFVLYVSTFEARKNHRLLLQVWKDLYRERGEACPMIVFVGMFGWRVADLWAELEATEVYQAGRIVLLQQVSDALLGKLYQRCAFTVFPSFYEGWGLAASESLAYGKLALISSTPALTEATQGLCPAFHPLDFPAWHEAIRHYLDDAPARAALEARIRRDYRPRDWSTFSRELLAAARETA